MTTASSLKGLAELLAATPAGLDFSFALIDDEQDHLRMLLTSTLPELVPLSYTWPPTLALGAVHSNVSNRGSQNSSEETLRSLNDFLLAASYNFLLVNTSIDAEPPGDLLYRTFSLAARKVPVPIFLFATEDRIDTLQREFLPRGAECVLPLSGEGMKRFLHHLLSLAGPRAIPLIRPLVHYKLLWHLAPEQEDLLRLLFVSEDTIDIEESAGGGAASRRVTVITGNSRRYFVKFGRWDSLTTEYANYVNFIQGKHENYAGRALSSPEIRGSEAALCFSLASTGNNTETVSLRDFLLGNTTHSPEFLTNRGVEFLTNLNTRIVRNLGLTSQPFEPLSFLSVLPALLTVKHARFVSPTGGRTESATPPQPAMGIHVFPPPDEISREQSLRSFLGKIEHALLRKEQPEVQLNALTIREVRFDTENDVVIVQLSDLMEGQSKTLGYKVNVHLANTGGVSSAALFASLKLLHGRQVWVQGVITKTLLSLVHDDRPTCDLRPDTEWAPEEWLYTLLFGTDEQGMWKRSCLANFATVPLGDFTHGDFNLSNILVEQRPNESPVPWLIDFEKSRGDFYPASDWAKLEVEIATHLTPAVTDSDKLQVADFRALEHHLWCPRFIDGEWLTPDSLRQEAPPSSLRKVAKLEDTIRRLAAHKLTSPEFADYLWAVFCHSLRALGLVPTRLGKIRAYVKAAIACKRIDQILRLSLTNQEQGKLLSICEPASTRSNLSYSS